MAKLIFNAGVFKDSPLAAASTATQVTVLERPGDTLAALWSDREGSTPKSNPFFISSAGKIEFYADPGRYRITASNSGFVQTWEDVSLQDPDRPFSFEYASMAALIAARVPASIDTLTVVEYYAGSGGRGRHVRYRTGGTNAAPTVGSAVAVSTIGTGEQAGYCWDAAGAEWKIAKVNSEIHATWFGWSSSASGTANKTAWQDAIEFTEDNGGGEVIIHESGSINGTVRGKRGVICKGVLGLTTITCDFTSWTGLGLYSVPDEVGYYIGQTGGSDFGEGYKQGLKNIIFVGSNNTTLESWGIYCGYSDRRDITASSIAFSARNIVLENVDVYKFDTAVELTECWESKFDKMHIALVRRALVVSGQAVNNSFSHINATAGRLDNTSSTDDTISLLVQALSDYGVAESTVKRPEGNNFSLCKFNGYDDGVNISNSLSLSIDGCIIDLHSKRAVFVGSSPGTAITKCYISNGGTTDSTIMFTNAGAATDLSCSIRECEIVNFSAGSTTQQALEIPEYEGIEYVGNSHGGYEGSIVCSFVNVRSATIRDNKFKSGLDSWAGQRCIEIQGGDRILIDGNQSRNDNKILNISTVNVPANIDIGANESISQRTSERGVVTIAAAATSTTIDFKHNNTGLGAGADTGLKSVLIVSCEQPGADLHVVSNGVNTNRATFSQNALGSDNKIYYQSVVLPSSMV